MSNALAVAAVTATLRRLIERGLEAEGAGIGVITRPPDRANQPDGQPNRVNLFLYQTGLSAAWRNRDLPNRVHTGEAGHPPLPLDLYYLITAYAENDDEVRSHRFLGRVMSVLHDHPLLGAEEIESALEESELHQQVERIRITPQALSLEEVSKLWSGFQTQYRLSISYQVSSVLIESTRPTRSPLPVLKRGPEDRGAISGAAPFATLTEVRPPRPFPAARLGDEIVLAGQQLGMHEVTARFTSSRVPDPIALDVAPGDRQGELKVRLPDATAPGVPAAWAPGFYTVALVVRRTQPPVWTSNEAAIALAPNISVSPTQSGPGLVSLTVTCLPRLRLDQRALLVFGDRQVAPLDVTTPADESQPSSLRFGVPDVTTGQYVVRLRVDGVDSIPLAPTSPGEAPALEFDANQTVTVA